MFINNRWKYKKKIDTAEAREMLRIMAGRRELLRLLMSADQAVAVKRPLPLDDEVVNRELRKYLDL